MLACPARFTDPLPREPLHVMSRGLPLVGAML